VMTERTNHSAGDDEFVEAITGTKPDLPKRVVFDGSRAITVAEMIAALMECPSDSHVMDVASNDGRFSVFVIEGTDDRSYVCFEGGF